MFKLLGQFASKKDKSKKWVFTNDNNEIVEVSLLSTKKQDLICIPTHFNCPLGCTTCNIKDVCSKSELKPIDFMELMQAIEDSIISWDTRQSTNTKVLVSFSGVGEPLLNMPLLEKMYKGQYNFERLGYNKIAFEISTMMPNENLEKISRFVDEGKYPIRVVYRLSSPVDDKRKLLAPSTTLSVDTSLCYLHRFNEHVQSNPEIKKKYREFFGSKTPVEIFYSIIPDVNDSLFELANLQYFGSRFSVPITFLKNNNGEEKWKEDILSHYPDMKVRIAKPIGRDIGCIHGEFDLEQYPSANSSDKVIDYEVLKNNQNQAVKKVLKNNSNSAVGKVSQNKVV